MAEPNLTEGLFDTMRTMRSIRRYRPDPIPDDVVDAILEAGVLAAFPHNDVLRFSEAHDGGSVNYQVRLSLPASLAEAREGLRTIRRGLG